jgi:nicotinamidase-related amidase
MIVTVLGVDFENDFILSEGSLCVNGALRASMRFSNMIEKEKHLIDNILAPMDKHYKLHINHPLWWINNKGEHPKSTSSQIQIITIDDIKNNLWKSSIPEYQEKSFKYVEKFNIIPIWPYHCLVHTFGSNLYFKVSEAFEKWEEYHYRNVKYFEKGKYPFSDQLGAIEAMIPDPNDSSTCKNISKGSIIYECNQSDIILCGGIASSHCLMISLIQIIENLTHKEDIQKIVFLEDCTAPVKGYEKISEDFINEYSTKGMKVCRSDKISL